MTRPPEPSEPTIADLIQRHDGGAVNTDATMALREVCDAVTRLGRAGSVPLKVKVIPGGGNLSRTVAVGITVTAKLPQPQPALAVRFVGPDHGLYRDDPYQGTLDDIQETE